jgi:hypothetical protein
VGRFADEIAELENIAADPTLRILDRVAAVLTLHVRVEGRGCLCGWNRLGHSFAAHQAETLEAAGLLIASGSAPSVGG